MIYFSNFPIIEYSGELATNLLVRGKIRDAIKSSAAVYYEYTIKDTDRADILSFKYYGTSSLVWTIFYANDIFDPFVDWPRTNSQFNEFIIRKYGSIEKPMITPHHYLLDDTYIIDKTTFEDVNIPESQKKMITEYQYELDLNEEKRDIKIIDVIYIRQLTNELLNLFK